MFSKRRCVLPADAWYDYCKKDIAMRYSQILLVFLVSAGALAAADPFAGSWKLNSAQARYSIGMPPKEQTVTFTEEGSNLDVVVKGTSSDGQPIFAHFTVPTAGGPGKIIEAPYDAVSAKMVSPNERVTSLSKGGKIIYTTRAKRSADGKTMTVEAKGTNPAGQTVEAFNHYDKQ